MVLALAFFTLAGCHEAGHIDLPGNYGSAANEIVGEVTMSITAAGRSRSAPTRAALRRCATITTPKCCTASAPTRWPTWSAAITSRRVSSKTATAATRPIQSACASRHRSRGTVGVNRLDRIQGRVEYVDNGRGTFELRDSRNRLVVVAVDFNAPKAVTDRFKRLRNGDQVRIEGRSVSVDRFELESFL